MSRRWSLHPCQSLSQLPAAVLEPSKLKAAPAAKSDTVPVPEREVPVAPAPDKSAAVPKLSAPAPPLSGIMNLPRAPVPPALMRPNPRALLPNPSLR